MGPMGLMELMCFQCDPKAENGEPSTFDSHYHLDFDPVNTGVQELQKFRSSGACIGRDWVDLRFWTKAVLLLVILRSAPP